MKFKAFVLLLATFFGCNSVDLILASQAPQQNVQLFDPIVKRLHDSLKLNDEQMTGVRDVFARHIPRVTDLRARAQSNPYNPQLQPDIDKEQREIRDELSALFDEEQKGKFASVDTRLPIQLPPAFIVVSIPPANRTASSNTVAAREPFVTLTSATTKSRSKMADDQRILHLLDRITFGPRPGDIDRIRQQGLAKYIETQLDPDSVDDSDLSRRLAVLPTQQLSTVELFQFYPPPNQIEERSKLPNPPPVYGRPQQVMGELVQQKLVRAVSSNRQLQEVLTDFWFNHFNVFGPKDADQWFIASYERDVIRPRVLGKFRDLLTGVAESPAMLFYLDNWLSFAPDAKEPRPPAPPRPAGTPNNTTPPKPAAKPVTTTAAEMTRPAAMEQADKKSSGNPAAPQTDQVQRPASATQKPEAKPQTPPPPRPSPRKRDINENYARELLELHTLGVDGGYTQKDVQEVARCFTGWTIDRPYQGGTFTFKPWMHDQGAKTVLGVTLPAGGGMSDGIKVIEILSRHPSTAKFVSKKLCQRFVSDDPSPQLVERIAQVFLKTDGDLKEVMRAILNSPEFNSPATFRTKVKSPLELAASAIRALDGDTNGGPPLHDWLRKMGEPLYQYQFPTGYSEKSATWVNTGVFFNRINFTVALANNQVGGTQYDASKILTPTAGYEEAVKQLSALLIHSELSEESLKAIEVGINQQQTKPADAHRQLIGLLLGAAEFQKK